MTVRFVAVCLLVVAAPFEPRVPLGAVAGLSITLTELIWMMAAAVWAGSWVLGSSRPRWRSALTMPLVAFLGAMGLAALFAESETANALKATGRLTVMVVTAWMTATSLPDPRRFAGLLAAVLATGVVVALWGIVEVLNLSLAEPFLELFRDHARFVGGEVRASSTLQYPTIAAAYLTTVLCLGAGLGLWLRANAKPRAMVVVLALVAILAAGVALTLTRAAVLAAMAGLIAVAWLLYRVRAPRPQMMVVAACLACVLVAPVGTASTEMSRLRWSSEDRGGWYRAVFDAPAVVDGRPGALLIVPIVVTNDGRRTWLRDSEPPIRLSYHVIESTSLRVVRYDGVRTPLPADVTPGSRVRAEALVRLPIEPGEYRLAWDMVHERRLWFGAEPGAPRTFSRLRVAGAPVGAAEEPRPSSRAPHVLESALETPGRRVLWGAALAMAAAAPLLGVGPDNFRLTSRSYLGPARSDPRVHSNNMYLEVLTGGGMPALALFLLVIARAARLAGRLVRSLPAGARGAYMGACAAGIAWLAHGGLDSFLTFTPTLLMTGVVLGLIVAPSWWAEAAA